jgi:hypothetical protein
MSSNARERIAKRVAALRLQGFAHSASETVRMICEEEFEKDIESLREAGRVLVRENDRHFNEGRQAYERAQRLEEQLEAAERYGERVAKLERLLRVAFYSSDARLNPGWLDEVKELLWPMPDSEVERAKRELNALAEKARYDEVRQLEKPFEEDWRLRTCKGCGEVPGDFGCGCG